MALFESVREWKVKNEIKHQSNNGCVLKANLRVFFPLSPCTTTERFAYLINHTSPIVISDVTSDERGSSLIPEDWHNTSCHLLP